MAGLGGTSLVVYDLHGAEVSVIADFADVLSVGSELNEVGAANFTLSSSSVKAQALARMEYALLQVREGTASRGWLLLDEDDYDPASTTPTITFSGYDAGKLLDGAVLFPAVNGDSVYTILRVSPGTAWLALLAAMHARGTLDGVNGPLLTTSANENVDSAGTPWPETIWYQYDLGTTYTDILRDLASKGIIDWRVTCPSGDPSVGLVLELFVQGTAMGVDRPGAIFHRTREVTAAENRHVRVGRISSLTVKGEQDTLYDTFEDSDSIGEYGRVEGWDAQGGVADYPTLAQVGTYRLEAVKDAPQALTVDWSRDAAENTPQPFADFGLGDYVRCDWVRDPATQAFPGQRVHSLTLTYDTTGMKSAEAELNNIVLEREVVIARAVDGLLKSSSPTGGIGTPVGADSTIPDPPTGLVVSSAAVIQADGSPLAYASVEFDPPLLNTDGSAFDDLGSYLVSVRVGYHDPADLTSDWTLASNASQSDVAGLGSFIPGTIVQARVATQDYTGHVSDFAYSDPVVMSADAVPPDAPGAPGVTALPGGFYLTWNGLEAGGAAQPLDYSHVEVHMSTSDEFTPDASTLRDVVFGPAALVTSVIVDVPYHTDEYVRLVSVDTSGNKSGPGTQVGPVQCRVLGAGDIDPLTLTDTDHSGRFFAPDLQGTPGTALAADPTAYGGQALTIPSGSTSAGPGYTALQPGRYRASWRVYAGLSTATDVGSVDVTGPSVQSDGAATVTGPSLLPNGWGVVSVRFTVTAASGAVNLPLTAHVAGVRTDLAYIEPITSLALLEVQDEQVASLSATKLTASEILADLLIAGRISTAVSGSRVEFNAAGLFAYATVGGVTTQTVKIGADGSAVFSGTVQGAEIVGSYLATSTSPPLIEMGPAVYLGGRILNQPGVRFRSGNDGFFGGTTTTSSYPGMSYYDGLSGDGSGSFLWITSGYDPNGPPGVEALLYSGSSNPEDTPLAFYVGNAINNYRNYALNSISFGRGLPGIELNSYVTGAYDVVYISNTNGGGALGLYASATNGRIDVPSASGALYVQADAGTGGYQPVLASAFTMSSTVEGKTSITELGDVLDRMRRVKPIRFQHKHRTDRPNLNSTHDLGFAHEEMIEHFPEAAPHIEDEIPSFAVKGVDVGGAVAVAWRGVVELAERLDDLSARVATLAP